uniref:Xylulose kinase-1 n=1 Tax=Tanacetum cinerariifolium TaxID=118510 RepID=A0A6L2N9C7_TANCI|nr:hypothetical protein [Tanacetum cinerariifolium]
MTPLTFADTHNMVLFLSKSGASDGFDQIVDFLNAHTIKYALMVRPTIYVSCIKQFWATAIVEKVNGDVQLQALIDDKKVVVMEAIIIRDLHLDDADGVKCLPNADIFEELARMRYEKPPQKLTIYKAFFSPQLKFLIHTIIQCRKFNFSKYIFDSMVRNVDSLSVETPLFDSMLVQSQQQAEAGVEVPITHVQPSITSAPSLTELQDDTPTPNDTPPQYQPPTHHDSPLQHQPTTPYDSPMPLLTTLMETCATLSQKRVSVVIAPELVSIAEPTMFDDEGVTMTMAQTLIKLKVEKARILDEKIAQKLHDEEVQKAAARDEQERTYKEKALELQRQYRDLKKKPVSVAQARKNMMMYLKNMAGYKMKFFKGMIMMRSDPYLKENMLKGFDREDLVALWNLVKERFSSAKPIEDKERALWVELKRLFEPDADDVLWKLQRYIKRLPFVKCCHDLDAEWKTAS